MIENVFTSELQAAGFLVATNFDLHAPGGYRVSFKVLILMRGISLATVVVPPRLL